MSDEFMRRLAPLVAEFLPVVDGENLEQYTARVRLEPIYGRRALIGACLGVVSDQFRAERQLDKAVWIAAARVMFDPGHRQACAVCGKYEGLTEAHHTLPLWVQFEAGAVAPIQDFDWLCPTHHCAQHIFINDILAKVTKSIPGLPPDESDSLHRLNAKMVDLLITLPQWQRVRP